MKPTDQIKALHETYVDATGIDLVLTQERMFAWEAWIEYGSKARKPWGVEQLRCTIDALQVATRPDGSRTPRDSACLKFRYLIEDPAHFEEELAQARQEYRIKQRLAKKPKFPADKASVCRSAGAFPGQYPDAPPDPAPRSVAQVLDDPGRESRLAAHLAALRAAAGMPAAPAQEVQHGH
jgi:hypothetical protein